MSLHSSRSSLSHLDSRVIADEIIVVMITQIQLYELGELTDGRRHISIKSEITEIYKGYTSIGMEGYSRLGAPKIRILVEVPVASCRMVLTYIIPVRSVQ